jgi:hypothetical protein
VKVLQAGLPTIRNRESGHGDGKKIKEIDNSYAKFAINLAGSNIGFLVDLYQKDITE